MIEEKTHQESTEGVTRNDSDQLGREGPGSLLGCK